MPAHRVALVGTATTAERREALTRGLQAIARLQRTPRWTPGDARLQGRLHVALAQPEPK